MTADKDEQKNGVSAFSKLEGISFLNKISFIFFCSVVG